MNIHLKRYLLMSLIQVAIGAVLDFAVMGKWGLPDFLLLVAWVSIMGVFTLAYWITMYFIPDRKKTQKCNDCEKEEEERQLWKGR